MAQQWWSSVGSAGITNPADLGKVVFASSIVQLHGGSIIVGEGLSIVRPPPVFTQAVVRYGVTPVDALIFDPGNPSNPLNFGIGLNARYREGQGRVFIRLMQVTVLTGFEQEIVTIDSNVLDPGPGGPDRFHTTLNNVEVLALDFNNNAYYIELTLSAEVPPFPGLEFPPAVSVIQLVWGGPSN